MEVQLHPLPHEEFIHSEAENWAGVTNPKERKRLQNRLNQRARRQRKINTLKNNGPVALVGHTCKSCHPKRDILFGNGTEQNVDQLRNILHRLTEQAMARYAAGSPSADHLLSLIQLNVINSLTRNSALLGIKADWLICASVSPFTAENGPQGAVACPEALIPTKLQREMPHHPWIDLLPLPQLRDNFLLAVTKKLSADDEERLWIDMIESGGEKDWTGMIVWGNPWEVSNWEVTLPFFHRWSWLLDGCPEMMQSTNYWRRQRGERYLLVEA